MDKKIILIGVIVLVVIVGGFFIFSESSEGEVKEGGSKNVIDCGVIENDINVFGLKNLNDASIEALNCLKKSLDECSPATSEDDFFEDELYTIEGKSGDACMVTGPKIVDEWEGGNIKQVRCYIWDDVLEKEYARAEAKYPGEDYAKAYYVFDSFRSKVNLIDCKEI